MESAPRKSSLWKQRLQGAVALALSGAVLGVVTNAVRPDGLSLRYSRLQQAGLLNPVQRLADEGETVDLAFVRSAVETGTAIVIDARPAGDYRRGHIPGSFSLPFNRFSQAGERFQRVFSPDTSLVVYCSGGSCNDSVVVRDKLLATGYLDVKLFPGGWKEWTHAQLPVEEGPDPLSRQ